MALYQVIWTMLVFALTVNILVINSMPVGYGMVYIYGFSLGGTKQQVMTEFGFDFKSSSTCQQTNLRVSSLINDAETRTLTTVPSLCCS